MAFNPNIAAATQTYTPIATLVGGSGNTVPVYTTNIGIYAVISDKCFVDILFSGDGGAEGAGTGQFNISLPVTANASQPTNSITAGSAINNTTFTQLFVQIAGSATTAAMNRINAGSLVAYTGADQGNTTRSMRIAFWYWI